MGSRSSSVFLLAMAVALGGGCAKKAISKETDIERAYRLIDLKRGAEAVVVLDPYYKSNPNDRDVLLALASAHASVAHLEIYNYYGLYQEFVKIRARKVDSPEDKKEDTNEKLNQIAQTLYRIADLMVLFKSLPQIRERQLPHLKEAIRLADLVTPRDPSTSLFIALLRTVELKTFIYEKILKVSFVNPNWCRSDLEVLPRRLRDLVERFELVIDNLNVAFKNSSESLKEALGTTRSAAVTLEKLRLTGQATDLLATSWIRILFKNEIAVAATEGKALPCQ